MEMEKGKVRIRSIEGEVRDKGGRRGEEERKDETELEAGRVR